MPRKSFVASSVKTKFNMSKSSLKSPKMVINQMTGYAPIALFVTMLLMFTMMGVLQFNFYGKLFTDSIPGMAMFLGLGIAIIFQVARVASGLTSAFHFKNGNYLKGIMVMVFSLWLSFIEHSEAAHMAELWSNVPLLTEGNILTPTLSRNIDLTEEALILFIRCFVWAALALEFFLALTLTGDDDAKAQEEEDEKDFLNDESFSSNGHGKKIKAHSN